MWGLGGEQGGDSSREGQRRKGGGMGGGGAGGRIGKKALFPFPGNNPSPAQLGPGLGLED